MNHVAVIRDRAQKDVISVSWDSSDICNYRCSYCEDSYNGGKNQFPPIEKVVRFLSRLVSVHKKHIFIEMKGGEPTLWKELPEFLRICKENNWGVSIVTNGSRSLEWWKQNCSNMTFVNMSVHPEYFDFYKSKPTLDYLYHSRQISFLYLMYPPLFDKAQSDIELLLNSYPSVNLVPLVVAQPKTDNLLYSYTAEQQEFINKLQNRIFVPIKWPYTLPFFEPFSASVLDDKNNLGPLEHQTVKLKNLNSWKGWSCRAGLDRIHIAVNGDIFRGQCMVGGKLGNLLAEDYVLPVDPTTCDKSVCFCGLEMSLDKWDQKRFSIHPHL